MSSASTSTPSPPPDADARAQDAARLARRIVGGDAAAEAELAERYRRGLVFMLLERCGDSALAEDLAQETLRVALEKLREGALREPEKLPGFLRGTARHLLLAERRRHVNRPAPALDDVAPPVDPRPDPEQRSRRLDDIRRVRRLLAELEPERDREVLTRFYLLEQTREVICADLGLGRVHFNRVVHRARGRFRQLLESAAETESG